MAKTRSVVKKEEAAAAESAAKKAAESAAKKAAKSAAKKAAAAKKATAKKAVAKKVTATKQAVTKKATATKIQWSVQRECQLLTAMLMVCKGQQLVDGQHEPDIDFRSVVRVMQGHHGNDNITEVAAK